MNRLGRTLGLVPVLWSVDSRDWQLPGTKAIVERMLAHVRPGSIVLMHDGGATAARRCARFRRSCARSQSATCSR